MASTIDFRHLDEGFGGKTYKRKREQAQAVEDAKMEEIHAMEMETDDTAPPAKRSAIPSESDPNKPSFSSFSFGKPTYDGVIAGRVSGRNWKQVRTRRSSAMQVSKKGTTFEERARAKSIKMAFKERMTELKEEIRANKVEKRKKKEEREKKKKENILRTGTKLQKVTNPKTLKKIAKSKQRKQLRMVPDDSVRK